MGESLRFTAPKFIGTEGIQFTVARDFPSHPTDQSEDLELAVNAVNERGYVNVESEDKLFNKISSLVRLGGKAIFPESASPDFSLVEQHYVRGSI